MARVAACPWQVMQSSQHRLDVFSDCLYLNSLSDGFLSTWLGEDIRITDDVYENR